MPVRLVDTAGYEGQDTMSLIEDKASTQKLN